METQDYTSELNITGKDLANLLSISPAPTEGVFGICYSVLTWSGIYSGLKTFDVKTWGGALIKTFANGHAMTFLLEGDTYFSTSGIGEKWMFSHGEPDEIYFAKKSYSTTTYIYYTKINTATITRYKNLIRTLKKQPVKYSVLHPNALQSLDLQSAFLGSKYQNCVSHSHYLMRELGLISGINQSYGWWMPSISSWADWFRFIIPSHITANWNYKLLQNYNTNLDFIWDTDDGYLGATNNT